jgi:hypothetical protein
VLFVSADPGGLSLQQLLRYGGHLAERVILAHCQLLDSHYIQLLQPPTLLQVAAINN